MESIVEEPDVSRLDPVMQRLLCRILEDHQREVEGWMEQQHAKLQAAVLGAQVQSERMQSETSNKVDEENPKSFLEMPSQHSRPESLTTVEHERSVEATETALRSKSMMIPKKNQKKAARSITKLTRENSAGLEPGSFRYTLHELLKGRLGIFLGLLILVSTVLTFIDLQVHGDGRRQERFVIFDVCAHLFTVAFLVELLARLYVYRLLFFRSLYNWLDAVIIVLTCMDSWVLSNVDSDIVNIAFLRMVRFVRVARTLRVMRTLGLFANLRVLMNAIFMSMPSLFWSMLVLLVFMVSGSLFLCQMLQDFIRDPEADAATQKWVKQHYGTSSKALYTVFELTLSGCWPNKARILIEDVNTGYAAFFVAYVTAVVFAMIRIISALFLKDTLTCTANDDELICVEKEKEVNAVKAKLQALFREADVSKDGYLDLSEFEQLLQHSHVKVWLQALGIDVRSALSLFALLDKGNGYVSQREFLDGILRLRGSARSQDLLVLMRTTESILQHQRRLNEALQGQHQHHHRVGAAVTVAAV